MKMTNEEAAKTIRKLISDAKHDRAYLPPEDMEALELGVKALRKLINIEKKKAERRHNASNKYTNAT